MVESPNVIVENQLVRFIPTEPVDSDLAVRKLGAQKKDDYTIHILDTPRATIVIDKDGNIVVHGSQKVEAARAAAREFLLRLGLSDEGLSTELGSVVASFKFNNPVKTESVRGRIGPIATLDERLGCSRIVDKIHNMELLIWPNGKVIALGAKHHNLVMMAAQHWLNKFSDEKLFILPAIND